MPYVITNGTEYIMKNHEGKYIPIRNAALADEFDKTTAERILKNSVAKRNRVNMKVVRVESKNNALTQIDNQTSVYVPDQIKSWIQKIHKLNGLTIEAENRRDELHKELSRIDKSICDLAHYVEFRKLNACLGYEVYKKWHDLRLERRQIKNELDVVNIILNKDMSDSLSDAVDKFVNGLTNKNYEPRVLKDLFD